MQTSGFSHTSGNPNQFSPDLKRPPALPLVHPPRSCHLWFSPHSGLRDEFPHLSALQGWSDHVVYRCDSFRYVLFHRVCQHRVAFRRPDVSAERVGTLSLVGRLRGIRPIGPMRFVAPVFMLFAFGRRQSILPRDLFAEVVNFKSVRPLHLLCNSQWLAL